MRVDNFDYDLPEELIAQHPLEQREISKMMVLNRANQSIEHKNFFNIVDYLNENDLLVINNTKVIPARIFSKKETGANIEIFLLNEVENNLWQCLLRPSKRIKADTKLFLPDNSYIKVVDQSKNDQWIIEVPDNFREILDKNGNMPLPPYIKREKINQFNQNDSERYQTVFAKNVGAVAAPTAGLHFSPQILDDLRKKGIKIAEITLHVGLGTFKPVKCELIEDHIMHEEYYCVDKVSSELINQYLSEKKRIVGVGTTSIRTLETIAGRNKGKITESSGWSNLFIYPGFDFKVINACITNFHLPKSTLIMLVSAFAGKEFTFNAYKSAIENKYRFFSYGDCMLIH